MEILKAELDFAQDRISLRFLWVSRKFEGQRVLVFLESVHAGVFETGMKDIAKPRGPVKSFASWLLYIKRSMQNMWKTARRLEKKKGRQITMGVRFPIFLNNWKIGR